MQKKILKILICAALTTTLCACGNKDESAANVPPPQFDDERVNPIEETKPEWEYRETDDGELSISAYNGKAAVVEIPAEIDGKPVKRLGFFFNIDNDITTTLKIPACIEYIPSGLGENLTEIIVDEAHEEYYSKDGVVYKKLYNGTAALCNCPQGKKGEFVVPDGIAHISDGAFSNCDKITAVKIPDSVEYIGTSFQGCTALTSVNLPKDLTTISGYTFSGCTSLETLEIPETVREINLHAFEGTPFLEKLIKQDPLVVINGILVDGTTLKGEVTIPESVTKISYEAFAPYWSENTGITKIMLPENLTEIDDGAFSNCTALEEVALPAGIKTIGMDAFGGCSSLKRIDLPSGLTEIGAYSFSRCTSLTSVDIPNGVKRIGMSAFRECENLESVSVPDSVIYVSLNDCFDGCEKINVTFKGKTYTAANIEEFYAAVEDNMKGAEQ